MKIDLECCCGSHVIIEGSSSFCENFAATWHEDHKNCLMLRTGTGYPINFVAEVDNSFPATGMRMKCPECDEIIIMEMSKESMNNFYKNDHVCKLKTKCVDCANLMSEKSPKFACKERRIVNDINKEFHCEVYMPKF